MGNICKISAASTRGAPPPLEDPVTASRTDELLNRWRAGEVTRLQRLYRKASAAKSHSKRKTGTQSSGMDKASLLLLFDDYRLVTNAAVGDAVFGLFDSSSSGMVSFRDFCRALAWCCRGTRLERLRFLFCLFAMYEQQQLQHQQQQQQQHSSSHFPTSSSKHQQQQAAPSFQTATDDGNSETNKKRPTSSDGVSPDSKSSPRYMNHRQLLHEELALGDLDTDGDSSPKLGRQGLEALIKFCYENRKHQADVDLRLSFNKFVEWSEKHLSDTIVDQALEPLCVLSTPRSEREAVFTALKSASFQPGDTVFAIESNWWQRWTAYAQLTEPLPPALVNLHDGNNGVVHQSSQAKQQQRPDEIDNSCLVRDGALKGTDASLFVLVPRSVWELVTRWYGGGPALPRTILPSGKVDLHPVLVRVSACDRNGEVSLKAATTRVERFASEINLGHLPKAEALLRAYFFQAACQDALPSNNGEQHTEHSPADQQNNISPTAVTSDAVYEIELTPGQRRRVTPLANRLFAGAPPAEMNDDLTSALRLDDDDKLYLAKRQAERNTQQQQIQHQGSRKPISSLMAMALSGGSAESPPTGVALAYPEDENTHHDEEQLAALGIYGAGERALRFSTKSEVRLWYRRAGRSIKETATSSSRSKVSKNRAVSQHPLRWRLLDAPSLSAAGIESMDEILIEFCDPVTGEWPRAKFAELSADLKVGDRLDACDYRGKWFPGSVVELERPAAQPNDTTTLPPRRVRVRFDRFHPKWDEWYDVSSSGLAPLGTRAMPPPTQVSTNRGEATSAPAPPTLLGKRSLSVDSESGIRNPVNSANSNGSLDDSHQKGGAQKNGSKDATAAAATTKDVLPGSTGLLNLGNTCYMNSALQCLSHTPLLRAYILSEGYSSEVNRTNPLGTQGRMVEEFAAVLKQLWAEQYRYIAPNKFKRTLARLKPQFAGNDQHDSQEFLAEMLDMLHEDVNRVVEKPYVVEPDDDEVDKLTSIDAAKEAWERYLLRNRSVIVDLFQGQLMSERTCSVCSKRSLKFETFMYLSVPLPAPRDRAVKLMLLTRAEGSKLELKHLRARKIPPTATAAAVDIPPATDDSTETATAEKRASWTGMLTKSENEQEGPQEKNHAAHNGAAVLKPKLIVPRAVKYVFELPRLGTVAELKNAVATRSGLSANDLVIGDIFRHRFLKVWHDTEPLARIGEDDFLVAYESTPEAPADFPEDVFPSTFDGLRVGTRVDALDMRGHWFIGMVVAINESNERRIRFDRFASKWDEYYGPNDWTTKLAPPYTNSKRKARIMEIQVLHRRLRAQPVKAENKQEADSGHDAGGPDAEGERQQENKEASSKKLLDRSDQSAAPAESEVRQPMIPRRPSDTSGVELFGTPFIVRIESDMQVDVLYSKVMKQARAFINPKWHSSPGAQAEKGHKAPFELRLAALTQPNLVRTPALNEKATAGTSVNSSEENKEGSGSRPPSLEEIFRSAPDILASGPKGLVTEILDEARGAVTLDWLDPRAYEDCFEAADAARDASCDELLDDDGRLRQSGGYNVSLASCLDAFSKEETLADDNFWFCPKCKVNRRAISRILPWKLPDILVIHMKRFLCSAQWREKINTRVDFPLTSLDMSTWVHPDASGSAVHHHGAMTYDLFGVINHLGGMTGGHYTSYVRSVPCSRDGVEEVASSFPTEEDGLVDYRWLHVDDDLVEEVGPHQIVTEAAYVLFYRRRSLTPATVINLSAFQNTP